MNNIQYFSNGVRRFQTGGQVSYKGIPAASKNLDQQFLADLKKWQNGEIEWTDEMSRYYTNVSTDTKYNKAGRQWQEVNKEVKTWDTPGAVDSEGRISLPAVTITAKRPRKEEELKDIYGIPYSYSDSDRAFIRRVQERPNYKGLMYGMNAAAIAPGLLALSGMGATGAAGTRALQTLAHVGKTGAPSTAAQYFSAQPLSFGTKLALTADGTAVAIPSVSVNIPSMLPSLGASTVLGKLLYDGRTMNAAGSAYAQNKIGFKGNVQEKTVEKTPTTENDGEGNGNGDKEPGKFRKRLHDLYNLGKNPWVKWPARIATGALLLKGAYQWGASKEVRDDAKKTAQEINNQSLEPVPVDYRSTEEIQNYWDSVGNAWQQFKIDTL